MSRMRKIFFVSGFILIIYSLGRTLDNESLTIHPFLQSENYCVDCHAMEKNYMKRGPALACTPFCLTCHKEIKNHHVLNIKITETLPEGFILTERKKLICITCHNLNNKRFDNTSWKAESLYEKVFKGEKKYKTYYLVKKNNEGQLCKTCH